MALKPTIYKLKIDLSNTSQGYYDALNLTIALHPSETTERMMARVLAFCINAEEGLSFTKGLSAIEEPDIWTHRLDGQMALWIDVGEPSSDRIKKAARVASIVRIYSFNSKSDVWWSQAKNRYSQLKASVYQFQWSDIQAFAALLQRTMNFAVIITDNSAYIATELGECEINWIELQASS
jgi:uncharacterized protein YaeQ